MDPILLHFHTTRLRRCRSHSVSSGLLNQARQVFKHTHLHYLNPRSRWREFSPCANLGRQTIDTICLQSNENRCRLKFLWRNLLTCDRSIRLHGVRIHCHFEAEVHILLTFVSGESYAVLRGKIKTHKVEKNACY